MSAIEQKYVSNESHTHIEPLWVMVKLFSLQSHTGHEPKGLVEVVKSEGFIDGIASGDQAPVIVLQRGQKLGALEVGEFLGGRHGEAGGGAEGAAESRKHLTMDDEQLRSWA